VHLNAHADATFVQPGCIIVHNRYCGGMKRVEGLAEKLDMLLKASSMSRVALAQEVGVDKSLVGRWVKGTIHPGDHNLSRLTAVFKARFPELTLADWWEETSVLAERAGITYRPGFPAGPELRAEGPFAKIIESSEYEMGLRAKTYEGFWRTTRPSLLMPEEEFHDYGFFRMTENGMMEVRMEGAGLRFDGWMFTIAGNLYAFLYDPVGRTPLIVLMKGVTLPRAMSMEGLLLLSALDPARTPAAFPVLLERIGDLTGDREADEARVGEMAESRPQPIEPISDEERRALLYRDVGPEAQKAGGPLLLAISGAYSRGVTSNGLRG